MTDVNNGRYSGRDNLEAMLEAKNYNLFLVGIVKSFMPKVGAGRIRILDFGSGIGTAAGLLREQGVIVDCLEPDGQMANLLRDDGYTVYSDLSVVPDNTYDYIYTLNVLEHVQNDFEAVGSLSSKLRDGGGLLIYVPAFSFLYSPMDSLVGHFRRYSAEQLTSLVSHGKLTVIDVKYSDTVGFFASIAYKIFGSSDGVISPRQVRIFDRYCFPANYLLDKFCSRFFGKNVYCFCEKRV